MQMKSYLYGQGVFYFIDGFFPCPPHHVVVANDVSLYVNNFFLRWKQQDQLVLSALLSSFSMDCYILLLIAKPHIVFGVLLNKPLLLYLTLVLYNFMVLFKIFNKVVIWSLYLCKKTKALFDELVVGRSVSLENFNLYVFYGLQDEFKDSVLSLATKT